VKLLVKRAAVASAAGPVSHLRFEIVPKILMAPMKMFRRAFMKFVWTAIVWPNCIVIRYVLSLIPAKSFASFDDQAILFVHQPFHPGLLTVSGVEGFGLAVTCELDTVSSCNSFISFQSIE